MPINTSSLRKRSNWLAAAMLVAMFECVCITPLGSPVEPEVKITVIRSSGLRRLQTQHAIEQEGRHTKACERGGELHAARDLFQQVFQQDDFAVEVEGPLLEEPLAREHVLDARFADAVVHVGVGERVIEIDGDPRQERDGQVGQHAAGTTAAAGCRPSARPGRRRLA